MNLHAGDRAQGGGLRFTGIRWGLSSFWIFLEICRDYFGLTKGGITLFFRGIPIFLGNCASGVLVLGGTHTEERVRGGGYGVKDWLCLVILLVITTLISRR